MARIGVDLTPLLPGGENGGAAVLALELLQILPALAPDWEWVVFDSATGEAASRRLSGPNVLHETVGLPAPEESLPGTRSRFFRGAGSFVPAALRVAIRVALRDRARRDTPAFLASRRAGLDLVFSPFGSTTLIGRDLPFVAVVHDLLHQDHPEFLDPLLVDQRSIEMEEIVRHARKIVCVSDFARRSVLSATGVDADRVEVIPNMILQREAAAPEGREAVLARYGLEPHGYFLYPANSWPHKNHLRLLEGYARFRRDRAGKVPKLLLVGADTGRAGELASAVSRLSLEADVIRPGYVSDQHLARLYADALGMIYPSLYEGFGLPPLEAMAAGSPVACSRTASLPEVVGDAALFLDPASVEDIARAFGELASMGTEARALLVEKGFRRFREHGSPRQLASRYLDLLGGCLAAPSPSDAAREDPTEAVPASPAPRGS